MWPKEGTDIIRTRLFYRIVRNCENDMCPSALQDEFRVGRVCIMYIMTMRFTICTFLCDFGARMENRLGEDRERIAGS